MKRRFSAVTLSLVVLALFGVGGALAARPATDLSAYYPDLRTVVPQHLGIQNQQQREILRFSNGIANTGGGPWAMRPDPPLDQATSTVTAIQEIRDSNAYYKCGTQPKQVSDCYNVLFEQATSVFEYHPSHNHWHINNVAQFEVRVGSPTGPVLVNDRGQSVSLKTTFCLIDWYKLDDNSPSAERVFFDCYTSYQGISVGWVDQYHQATDGQQLDITGAPVGRYYLYSTANHDGVFIESTTTNNSAWVGFDLTRDSNGNAKITIADHSPCDSPGLCGENATNR